MSSDEITAGEPASVRGSLVGARLAFVAGRLGAEAKADILERLPPAEAKRMRSVAIDGDWFDYATLEAIDGRIRSALAESAANLAADLGAFTAEHHYRSVAKQIGELPAEKIP